MADNGNLTGRGRLQVTVFMQGIGDPAENATVRITHIGEEKVIEEIITDSSGQTPILNLAAPPVEFSLLPDQPYQPFSEYDVYVSMDGYDTVLVNGVQIFPNTIAYQDVQLVFNENESDEKVIISIQDPVLWGNFPPKIPEDAVKKLPESKGFVVLPKPVVPSIIVVHDGVPTNAAAKNYYVPFKDYIKNVASCEIYATWPEATIRANVLAIISLTLNRVYTEWYRSQGYSFTITNSTAFDQAFSYGRNIFEEISVVVDDVFTTFITKPGIRQPLFTQYCDGQNSTCPTWMSQWGSKDLGEQGYNSIDILKTYYGPEIFLMQAEKVEGVPSSFPGRVLQVGSTGQDVRTVQHQLNTISKNYPAIPKVKEDGVYGESTEAAVQKFQEVFQLPTSGMVDFATWYRLSFIYVAVTKIAEGL